MHVAAGAERGLVRVRGLLLVAVARLIDLHLDVHLLGVGVGVLIGRIHLLGREALGCHALVALGVTFLVLGLVLAFLILVVGLLLVAEFLAVIEVGDDLAREAREGFLVVDHVEQAIEILAGLGLDPLPP